MATNRGSATEARTPQAAPVVVPDRSGAPFSAFRVERAQQIGDRLEISGWSVGPVEFELRSNGERLKHTLRRSPRPDVAEELGAREPAAGFGFQLTGTAEGSEDGVELVAVTRTRTGEVLHSEAYPLALELVDGVADGMLGAPKALFGIDGAVASSIAGEGVFVGWILHDEETRIVLEKDGNRIAFLDQAYRFVRQDVLDLHGDAHGAAANRAGFIARIPNVEPGDTFRLEASRGGYRTTLRQVAFSTMPESSIGAAKWLFGAHSPDSEFHARVSVIDSPIISRLIHDEVDRWPAFPVDTRTVGPTPASPVASLIVPLYGRCDFVEHQLIEFARDRWLCDHAEVLYVIDDPKLVGAFTPMAEDLHRLYGVPFRWIWGGINRGFSGANNLGASIARGRRLLFMNSDVIPRGPGWLPPLLDVLDRDPKVGAVGPRLLFADGSIQHASMALLRREELGIWINHHPNMGLDPSLDPAKGLTPVAAITGACIAMRRRDFERIGGWDTGYLIGDFEDSDLCFKLREIGRSIAYLPDVELTHLERQSFRLLGETGFRNRVVIYNAARHQQRWVRRIRSAESRNDRT